MSGWFVTGSFVFTCRVVVFTGFLLIVSLAVVGGVWVGRPVVGAIVAAF